MVVEFSTHQEDKARYVCTFTIPISISNHPQAYLVPLRVGIEPLAVPDVLGPLVSFKVCEGDLNGSYQKVAKFLKLCSQLLILLIQSCYFLFLFPLLHIQLCNQFLILLIQSSSQLLFLLIQSSSQLLILLSQPLVLSGQQGHVTNHLL